MDDHDEPLTERWNSIATHLSALTEDRPKSWWFWRARGHVRMRASHPDLAESDYDKAIEVEPGRRMELAGSRPGPKNRGQKESGARRPHAECRPGTKRAVGLGDARRDPGYLIRWDEAAEAYDRWSALGGDPGAIPWYYHAVLRLYAGDHPGYRLACQAMMDRFRHDHRSLRSIAGGPRL